MDFHLPRLKPCVLTGLELPLYLPHAVWNLLPLATCLVEVIGSLENEWAMFQQFVIIFLNPDICSFFAAQIISFYT